MQERALRPEQVNWDPSVPIPQRIFGRDSKVNDMAMTIAALHEQQVPVMDVSIEADEPLLRSKVLSTLARMPPWIGVAAQVAPRRGTEAARVRVLNGWTSLEPEDITPLTLSGSDDVAEVVSELKQILLDPETSSRTSSALLCVEDDEGGDVVLRALERFYAETRREVIFTARAEAAEAAAGAAEDGGFGGQCVLRVQVSVLCEKDPNPFTGAPRPHALEAFKSYPGGRMNLPHLWPRLVVHGAGAEQDDKEDESEASTGWRAGILLRLLASPAQPIVELSLNCHGPDEVPDLRLEDEVYYDAADMIAEMPDVMATAVQPAARSRRNDPKLHVLREYFNFDSLDKVDMELAGEPDVDALCAKLAEKLFDEQGHPRKAAARLTFLPDLAETVTVIRAIEKLQFDTMHEINFRIRKNEKEERVSLQAFHREKSSKAVVVEPGMEVLVAAA